MGYERRADLPVSMSHPRRREIIKDLPSGTYCFSVDGNYAETVIKDIPELVIGASRPEDEQTREKEERHLIHSKKRGVPLAPMVGLYRK